MRKIVILFISVIGFVSLRAAAPQSEITFETTVQNLGKISEQNPVRKCRFIFKNTGDAPLVINQAIASCGCTVPHFTEKPIKPGESGQIDVTYDGTGRYLKPFKKIISVYSNAKTKMVRLYLEGEMVAAKKEK